MIATTELCDRCSATAQVIVVLNVEIGTPDVLFFCAHHESRHQAALLAAGANIRKTVELEPA